MLVLASGCARYSVSRTVTLPDGETRTYENRVVGLFNSAAVKELSSETFDGDFTRKVGLAEGSTDPRGDQIAAIIDSAIQAAVKASVNSLTP